ncbi:Glycosyl transferases group 1 [compost metagenome]
MPVSLIEAYVAGLPVIASNCAGNKDIIDHGHTGWLFNSTDEAITHILFAMNNPDVAASKAKKAIDEARERFCVSRYVKEMESLV